LSELEPRDVHRAMDAIARKLAVSAEDGAERFPAAGSGPPGTPPLERADIMLSDRIPDLVRVPQVNSDGVS
jgi:hypothetical protein